MNKNIEPGKTLCNLRDGMGYLKVALTAKSKGTRQTAWVIVKEFWWAARTRWGGPIIALLFVVGIAALAFFAYANAPFQPQG